MRRSPRLLVAALCLLCLFAAVPPGAAAAGPVPVLLIHGYGGSPWTSFGGALPLFEAAGYRVGETLFLLWLPDSVDDPLGLFRDAGIAQAAIETIRQQTGAEQVDLIGHSRGGLIARILAAGETSTRVRRAVSIDTPHAGLLDGAAIDALLMEAGLPVELRSLLPIPEHLQADSPALLTLRAREERFASLRSPALAIGSLWREGSPAVLDGHDGIVPLSSQLDWPGARTAVFRLGPPPEALHTDPDIAEVIWQSPHAVSQRDEAVIGAAIAFLEEPAVEPPAQPPAAGLLLTACSAGSAGPVSRAEFVWALAQALGLPERLQPTPFADLIGSWAIGYVEAARMAGLVQGTAEARFEPERPVTRAEAVTLLGRALGLAPLTGAADGAADGAAGGRHWAAGWLGAAAAQGIIEADAPPDEPLSCPEGGLLLRWASGRAVSQ